MTTTTTTTPCPYCGISGHTGRCPEVKSMEYHPDGTVKRVEFFSPTDKYVPLMPVYPSYPPQWPYYPSQPWITYSGGYAQ